MVFLSDLAVCLRFFTRLPVPRMPGETDAFRPLNFATMAYAVPLAGLVIGALSATVFALAMLAGFSAFTAVLLAIIAELLLTGALHEDGLADVFDALGARDVARRLDILRDSRIGTYGALALLLSVLLRISLITEVAEAQSLGITMMWMSAGAALSRMAMLAIPALLPPARADGLGHGAGQPGLAGFGAAVTSGTAIIACLALVTGEWRLFVGGIACLGTALLLVPLYKRHFGGYSGDMIGAAQQMSLLAFWLAY